MSDDKLYTAMIFFYFSGQEQKRRRLEKPKTLYYLRNKGKSISFIADKSFDGMRRRLAEVMKEEQDKTILCGIGVFLGQIILRNCWIHSFTRWGAMGGLSHSIFFHSIIDIAITGEGLKILTCARR